MILYLARHGEAARPEPNQSLALTPRGRVAVAQCASALGKLDIRLDGLWHSPKTRATETADIFIQTLGIPRNLVSVKKELSPDGDAEIVYHELELKPCGQLLVVSHLPFLEDLTKLFECDLPAGRSLQFPTSGLTAFQLSHKWQWLWDLRPEA